MCEYENSFYDHAPIREFEEFDEKLPAVAKVIVQRGVDFSRLSDGTTVEPDSPTFEADLEAFQSVSSIFREMVECTSEMTADEFEYYIDMLLAACELVVLVNDGYAYEKENGKFFLTPEGEEILQEIEMCGIDIVDEDQAGN